MAKSTHQKQLERARARRARERAERRRATTVVVSVVAGLVVLAVALAGALLLRGESDDAGTELAGFDDADGSAPSDDATDAVDDATDDAAATGSDATAEGDGIEPCPVASGSLPTPRLVPYDEMPAADLAGASSVAVTLRTTCGDVELELDATGAPTTVANFVGLAQDGYYEGVGFHRVIEDFMIQGGDPTGTGTGCLDPTCEQRVPGYTFEDELGLAEQLVAATGGYPRGTVAMANAGADTNGSQFFIVQSEQPYPLPAAYAVFGEVTAGMDVVDRIALGPSEDQLAVDPVIILGVDVEL